MQILNCYCKFKYLKFAFAVFIFALFPVCCRAEWAFNKIHKLDSVPNGVSINEDGSVGYVVTYDGNCYEFVNGKVTQKVHVSEAICQDVAMASKADKDNIWIIDSNNELKVGSIKQGSSKFRTVYKFKSQANAIALSSDGKEGYIAEEDGSIDEFVNAEFKRVIKKIDVPITAIISTYDGRKIWFVTAKDELYEGVRSDKDKWSFKMLHKFDSSQSDVAISSDGSIGYVVSSGGAITYFKNGKVSDYVNFRVPNGAIAVSTTSDGKKIWITGGDFSIIEGENK